MRHKLVGFWTRAGQLLVHEVTGATRLCASDMVLLAAPGDGKAPVLKASVQKYPSLPATVARAELLPHSQSLVQLPWPAASETACKAQELR